MKLATHGIGKRPLAIHALGCLVALGLTCAGCSPFSPHIYDWSEYNGAMASEVINAEHFNRQETIQELREGLEGTQTNKIPPGALIHLAELMDEEGLSAESQLLLKRESELFPESAPWVNRLLQRESVKSPSRGAR